MMHLPVFEPDHVRKGTCYIGDSGRQIWAPSDDCACVFEGSLIEAHKANIPFLMRGSNVSL